MRDFGQMMDRGMFSVAAANTRHGRQERDDTEQVFADSSAAFFRFEPRWLERSTSHGRRSQ